MVEMSVTRLGRDSATNSYVVILREKHGTRLLPIWIGQPEAESIVMEMNQVKRERPLTHDLCKALIVALGGTLSKVTVTRVHKSTYFAELHLEAHGSLRQVDARPSDSIAIALRLGAPIFADEALLSNMDEEDELTEDSDPAFQVPIHGELTPEQLKSYLANLQPEDLGKFKP